ANPAFRLANPGATFHGRDLFAPAAAALAAGTPAQEMGPPVADPVRLAVPEPRATVEGTVGEVLWVDRFGNLITNLTPASLNDPGPDELAFSVRSHSVRGPAASYSEVAGGEPCVVCSSFGTFELAVR